MEHGYVEVKANCPAEAKNVAKQLALGGDAPFHDAELYEAKIESM